MKLLFVHSTRLKEDINGNLYTGGSYNKEVWDRYTSVFEDVSFLARKETHLYEVEEAEKKFNPFDKEKIRFIETYDLTSPSQFLNLTIRKKHRNIIEKSVMECDCLIIRVPGDISYLAIDYANKHNKPYLIEVVGCAWDSLWNHSLKGKMLAPLNYIIMKNKTLKAKHTIYVTNEFLQRRYPTNGKSIGISDVTLDQTDEKVLDKRIDKIKRFGENDKLILGTTAAIDVKYKGQQYVIEALGQLKKEGYTNFEYQVVGGGDSSFLKNVAIKHDVYNQVKFIGLLPHDKVFNWLDSIDIYIQPSKQEGLPRALVEAMSRGLPALGANTGGIPELLADECIFQNKTNVQEIVKLLQDLTQNKLKYYAKRNFEKSKEYNKNLLDDKRKSFLLDFKDFSVPNELSHNNIY